MKNLFFGAIAAFGSATCTAASPAATVLFAQEGTQIIDANGVARSAKKGDVVQDGERLLTTPGSISQIQLSDGSLIGMRPDSEMGLAANAIGAKSAPVVTLIQGTARIIGSELMDAKKASNITLQSGTATLRLQGADLESAVVRADKGASPVSGASPSAPGSYQRLLIGSGSMGTGAQQTSLTARQVNFVGANNTTPTVVSTPMPTVSMVNRTAVTNLASTEISGKNIQPTPAAAPNRVGMTTLLPALFADRTTAAAPVRNAGNLPLAPTGPVHSPQIFSPIANTPTLGIMPPISPVTLPPPPRNPTFTQPIISQPIITQPTFTQPIITQPLPIIIPKPITTQPIATQPIATQPIITKPITTQPITTQPITTQPITTQPISTQPITTQPITTQPITTQPITTQPIITQPITTQPIITKPITTQPITTQPITTQPIITKPITTQPITTRPPF